MCTYINIYTTESDSASKKKEILSQAMTWMDLEDILLSEAGSHKRTNPVRVHSSKY